MKIYISHFININHKKIFWEKYLGEKYPYICKNDFQLTNHLRLKRIYIYKSKKIGRKYDREEED